MRSGTPSFALVVLAALLSSSATLGFAQVTPGARAGATTAPPGATHDCSGMTGTALQTCQQLNRNADVPARTVAGTVNDCSGMTGAPLANCRRLNAAETESPTTGIGPSEDCSGQIGDALAACRALNGQPLEPDAAATTGAGAAGAAPQQ
jgi:hypothetical protein